MKTLLSFLCITGCIFFYAANVSAASARCTIVKIEGTKMTVTCAKGIERFREGGAIKIKSSGKKKIEGC